MTKQEEIQKNDLLKEIDEWLETAKGMAAHNTEHGERMCFGGLSTEFLSGYVSALVDVRKKVIEQ